MSGVAAAGHVVFMFVLSKVRLRETDPLNRHICFLPGGSTAGQT